MAHRADDSGAGKRRSPRKASRAPRKKAPPPPPPSLVHPVVVGIVVLIVAGTWAVVTVLDMLGPDARLNPTVHVAVMGLLGGILGFGSVKKKNGA